MVDGRCKSAPARVTSRVQVQTERGTARGFLPISESHVCRSRYAESFSQRATISCVKPPSYERLFLLLEQRWFWSEMCSSDVRLTRHVSDFFFSFTVPELLKGQFDNLGEKKQNTPVFAVQPQKTNPVHNPTLSLKHSDKHLADEWLCKISIILRDPSSTTRNVAKKTICAERKREEISFQRHFCRACHWKFVGRLWAKFTKCCKTKPQVDQSSQAKDLFPSRRVAKSSSAESWSYMNRPSFH